MNARMLYIVDDNSDFLEATSFWLSSAELRSVLLGGSGAGGGGHCKARPAPARHA